MALLTRLGTDLRGASSPGFSVRPVNDYISDNITMKVAVQAGQIVARDVDGLGILGIATGERFGVATETVPIGRRVACVKIGKMSGYSGGVAGAAIFAAAGGEVADSGTARIGQKGDGDTIFFAIL